VELTRDAAPAWLCMTCSNRFLSRIESWASFTVPMTIRTTMGQPSEIARILNLKRPAGGTDHAPHI
jgi:hypothetical protein